MELHLADLHTFCYHLTDLLNPLVTDSLIKENRDRDALFRRLHNMLEVCNDRIKQTEQKQTRRNRRNGSKGKPLVADNVHKALPQRIKQCTNPHRYNHLFPRR